MKDKQSEYSEKLSEIAAQGPIFKDDGEAPSPEKDTIIIVMPFGDCCENPA
jgi:hypothetical protein